jgi:DNA invertase Pin-like site-specific DNA recombinase
VGAEFRWGDVDTHAPMGSTVFTVMAALVQMELEIDRERITDSQTRNVLRLVDGMEPATQVVRDLGMSRATLYRRIRELPMPAA